MADYALTGKKGTGKSKHAVRIMRDRYLSAGRAVASNLDVNLLAMFGPFSRKTYIRLPDKPTAFDLQAAGHGNPDSYDEDKNGALFLDEMATWLNTRTFSDKDRAGMLDFIAHGRKLGWDSWFIMQDVGQVDKQLREAFIEYTVRHRRFDRMRVPFVGGLLSLLFGDKAGYLPRFHIAVFRAGTSPQDLVTDRVWFRGDDIHACYDTRQVFRPDYPHGTYSVLSPWHVEGRYLPEPAKPWLLRLWAGLWGQRAPVRAPTPVRPVDPVVVRVRALVARLPVDQRIGVMRRFLQGYGVGPESCAGAALAAPARGEAPRLDLSNKHFGTSGKTA